MLSGPIESKYCNIGFRFKENHLNRVVGIHSLGRERVNCSSYDWDGMQRDEKGKIIFQYTLSGMGEIDIAGKIYLLPSRNGISRGYSKSPPLLLSRKG